ncbi:MAG: hypothetical protein KatS3mg050_2865 [Litorilinea sp.]|nr:MAG: hypothetical protein KatS3mg050_2865 [Litorilinea sp.]
MKTIPLAPEDQPLLEYIERLETGENDDVVILTWEGKPIAAIIRFDTFDAELESLSRNPVFQRILAASRAQVREGKTQTLDEIEREMATWD